MFVKKRSLMKFIKISVLTTPTTANVECRFLVLTFLSIKLRSTIDAKLIRQTNDKITFWALFFVPIQLLHDEILLP